MTTPEDALKAAREYIDAIDDKILLLLTDRAKKAIEVAKIKESAEPNTPVVYYRPEREADILRRLLARNPGPLPNEKIVSIYKQIMSAALELQEQLSNHHKNQSPELNNPAEPANPSFLVKPSKVNGSLKIPPSKSQSLRAIFFASLADGTSQLHNILSSPDADAMIAACQQLGAQITHEKDSLSITGVAGKPICPNDVINAGNSGIVLRFIGAIAGLINGTTIITGDASIRNSRPVQPLLDGLNGLGAKAIATRNNGHAPITITGPMQAGKTQLDGQDSQPVSSLLIAASFLNGTTDITVQNPGELPWIDLTLTWLKRFDISFKHQDHKHYQITGPVNLKAFDYTVPGDLSSFSFPIAAALITHQALTLHGVDLNDPQGDKIVLDILKQMGASFAYDQNTLTLTVHPCPSLKGIDVNVNECIDAVVILAVIACYANGTTRLNNATIARNKESNRLAACVSELSKMGADIAETESGLIIKGSALRGARVHSHHDHRIAMALTVAGLGAIGNTQVDSIACIRKTYPDFAASMQHIGCEIEVHT